MLYPYPHNLMNAYPVSGSLVNSGANDVSVIQPVGKPIYAELQYQKVHNRLHQTYREEKTFTLEEIARCSR